MEVATGANFGLFAGTVSNTASFNNVSVSGKIVIGDDCKELIGANNSYSLGLLAGNGYVNGITHAITVEKANAENTGFTIEVSGDGYISLVASGN